MFLVCVTFHLLLTVFLMWQNNKTALMFAAEKGWAPVVDVLISAKADVNAVDWVRLICLLTIRTKCCACIFSGECYLASLIACLPHVAGQQDHTAVCR